MSIRLKQIGKIRGMSLDELRVRLRQGAAKLRDRFRRERAPEMSDAELAREFHPVWRDGTGEEAADKLRCRMRTKSDCFLPSLARRRKIVEMMNRRFPAERDAIINTAESALRGKFSLLGHGALSFGDPPYSPIDWLLDPVSGKRAPDLHWSKLLALNPLGGGDPKVVWELNRHSHFVTLGQAYWLTNDSRFAAGFVDQVSDWIDANPVGMGINWASSLEVAFRSISWLWATQMLVDSGEVTPDFFSRLLKSLIEHGRHVETYLSYYFSPNTHLTGEALGLFYLGAALPEMTRADGWRDLGLRILLEQARKQVRADGVYFEQSSYYHRYTTDFYTHLFALTRANDVKLDRASETTIWQKLEALLDHLMWITRPDGTSPLFGDDDGGRLIKLTARAANDFRDTLAIGSAVLNRGDWKYVAGDAPAEMLWLIGPEGVESYDQMRAEPPCGISKGFKSSGYFVMRDGWRRNSSFALIDCGPHGAEAGCGHAHADALSIEFASRGVTWIVDPGTQHRDRRRPVAIRLFDAVFVAHGRGMPPSRIHRARRRDLLSRLARRLRTSQGPGQAHAVRVIRQTEPARRPPGIPDRARSIHRKQAPPLRHPLSPRPRLRGQAWGRPRRGAPQKRRRADDQSHLRDGRQNRDCRQNARPGACQSRRQSSCQSSCQSGCQSG